MRKVFILAGELSGDKTASWYLSKIKNGKNDVFYEAVGGDHLVISGVKIYERFEKLNVTGLVEIIQRLRFIFKFLNKVSDYIIQNSFDEVILVDFPGFNLRLARKLKRKNPKIKITYLSPPQLWIWGVGRIKILKKYCDELIVLYHFEVDWYEERGIKAKYLGNPVYDDLKNYFDIAKDSKFNNATEQKIVIFPGSRKSEIKKLLPLFIQSINRFSLINQRVKIYLVLAESFYIQGIQKKLRQLNATHINIVQGENEKFKILRSSSLALSKPGTTILQLALFKIPTIVVYKTSWITYFLAKLLVHIKYMSLPNLFLNREMFKELIQFGCDPKNISKNLNDLYKSCVKKDERYENLQNDFVNIHKMFKS